MHKAILRLAKLRGETGVRLVTTNFDTLFEQASSAWHFGRDLHSGPILPIPRNDKAATWRSVVYLHGRLDEAGANEHLVMTSADFGRSYLTDAWALAGAVAARSWGEREQALCSAYERLAAVHNRIA
ncbi:SIR2 family protein, partial [Nonomuraea sp. NPDC003804]|uniref:SIR2 family protein n=1 Tax=Nonomuraea sp. NPDC003804 TaxID=3154547 RepID=UPI0033A746B1